MRWSFLSCRRNGCAALLARRPPWAWSSCGCGRTAFARAGSPPAGGPQSLRLCGQVADAQQRLAAEQRRFDDDQTQEVGVAGDKHAVADAVHRWTVAGADSVVLQPTGDDPDPAGFGRWIVDEVCPLIR